MLDYEKGFYWQQVACEAIVGSLIGEKLVVLPTVMSTWYKWPQLHPDTVVPPRDLGYNPIHYDCDPFTGYGEVLNNGRFAFLVSQTVQDGRLSSCTQALSAWALADWAIRDPLQGAQPSPVPSRVSYWFAIVSAEP